MRTAKLEVRFPRPLAPAEAAGVRGAVGRLFPEAPLLHHHNGQRLLYAYPLVQFKVINGVAVILGLAEGSALVAEIAGSLSGTQIRLADEAMPVHGLEVHEQDVDVAMMERDLPYRFLTPWFALNTENFRRYRQASVRGRNDMLHRILVGNILAMAKGLGFVVPEEIRAELDVSEKPITFKGQRMLGFLGTFRVNFLIPDLAGLGKSVSRGFGCVRRVQESGGEEPEAR